MMTTRHNNPGAIWFEDMSSFTTYLRPQDRLLFVRLLRT